MDSDALIIIGILVLLAIVIVIFPLKSFISGFIAGYRGDNPAKESRQKPTSVKGDAIARAREKSTEKESGEKSFSFKKETIVRKPEKQTEPIADKASVQSIFLSYRRDDSADVSGRIYDRLVNKFGRENIFIDVDSIPLGVDFRTYIDEMVSKADILLVVIGPDWLGTIDENQRKTDDPRDFVRLEVKSALNRDIPVIPLLVRNAMMPGEQDLPSDIKGLTFRNGIPVRSDPDFDNDITRLLLGLNKIV